MTQNIIFHFYMYICAKLLLIINVFLFYFHFNTVVAGTGLVPWRAQRLVADDTTFSTTIIAR